MNVYRLIRDEFEKNGEGLSKWDFKGEALTVIRDDIGGDRWNINHKLVDVLFSFFFKQRSVYKYLTDGKEYNYNDLFFIQMWQLRKNSCAIHNRKVGRNILRLYRDASQEGKDYTDRFIKELVGKEFKEIIGDTK